MPSDPVTLVLESLEKLGRRGQMVSPGQRWQYQCPAHDDRRPSLSISRGTNGAALIHCHAGCSKTAILSALGLTAKDLFPHDDKTENWLRKPENEATKGRREVTKTNKPCDQSGTNFRTFATASDALGLLRQKFGEESARWTYYDAKGRPVGLVVRWDRAAGKIIRPISRQPDGSWRIGAMPTPRPLYRLPELLKADPQQAVLTVEGEKGADAAVQCGLLATTSAGGAKAAGKSDWTPLAGRIVWLLPDNDAAGNDYVNHVAKLALAAGAREVRILSWAHIFPGRSLPAGFDIADAAGECQSSEDLLGLRMAIEYAAGLAEPVAPPPEAMEPAAMEVLDWQPFPVEALPPTVQRLAEEIAAAKDVDPAFVAAAALGVMAGCVGNARIVQVKPDWTEPAILWIGVVAPSGSGKTPVLATLFRPIEQYELRLAERNRQRWLEYEAAMAEYERTGRGRKNSGVVPDRPEKPQDERLLVGDATLEAVGRILAGAPRGLIMRAEELSLFLDVQRYKRGDSDAGGWCQCYDGRLLVVDRVQRGSLRIPRAAVCIVGGIQPAVLRDYLRKRRLTDGGLLPRMLLVAPPTRPRKWTDQGVSDTTLNRWATLVESLLALEMVNGPHGLQPVMVTLSAKTLSLFGAWYDELGELIERDELLRPWFSKLAGTTARIALVLHLARWIEGQETTAGCVSGESMVAAITIARWWTGELRRCLEPLLGSEGQCIEMEVLNWVRRRGGKVTARDLYRSGPRVFRNRPDEAERVLAKLAQLGYGTLETETVSPKGGRPKQVFRIADAGDAATKLRRKAEMCSFVAGIQVSKPGHKTVDKQG